MGMSSTRGSFLIQPGGRHKTRLVANAARSGQFVEERGRAFSTARPSSLSFRVPCLRPAPLPAFALGRGERKRSRRLKELEFAW
jgi:hypothetical protein